MRLSTAEREAIFAAVADERRSLADLVDGLDDQQLATPSLCAGWDVKTVAAHVVSGFIDGFWGFLRSSIRHGDVGRGIDALARQRAQASGAQIAAALREGADQRLSPPISGPFSGLIDVLVHGADMRIPLGLAHTPDPEHVERALDFLTSSSQFGFFPRKRLRGIALRDTLTGRTWGSGGEIHGEGADLMLTICGRTVAFERLGGAGVAVLRSRL